MLTIVVGQTGTVFRPPLDCVNLDISCDIDSLEASHVAFSIHRLFIAGVEDYIIDRLTEGLQTTVFIWNDEVDLMKNIIPHANVLYQHDTCDMLKCMQTGVNSFMQSDARWLVLCQQCYAKKKIIKNRIVPLSKPILFREYN